MASGAIHIKDNVTPALTRLKAGMRSAGLRAVMGRSGRNVVRTHLFGLDRARHRQHVKHHFYAGAARATNFRVVTDGAIISINQVGIMQRYYGGTITPRNSKYLTIPARTEAEGKRAREFDNLEIVFGRRGPVALAEKEGTKSRDAQGRFRSDTETGGGIMYWLVKSVTQRPDPSVLPDDEDVMKAVKSDVSKFIDRARERK